MKTPLSFLPKAALALALLSLSGCIILPDDHYHRPRRTYYRTYGPPPPYVYGPSYNYRPSYSPPPYYGPRYSYAAPVATLPYGAISVIIRGEQCWRYGGSYYRRHPRGYIVFSP